jgi:DNA (cytosine-5)-methyltransferase 1
MPTCISLFSGAGGLDLGLSEAGFDVLFANDVKPLYKQTYCQLSNFGANAVYHVGSACDVTRSVIADCVPNLPNQVDLLAGGPPCPPYSKSRFYRTEKPRGIADPLGHETLEAYLRLLEELRPRAFLFENVHGFAYKVHSDALTRLQTTASALGYRTKHQIINAADYGVPQIRVRFFMVGILNADFVFPSHTHTDPAKRSNSLFDSSLPAWRTAGEAIGDLDTEENASDEGHFAGGRHHDLLCQVPPGENYLFFTKERGSENPHFKWRSRYWSFLLKLSPDLPSWTIQARRSNNMGPLHWRNRILRIEEVRRLQTFPDHWSLCGTVEEQWRQLGNAVPPLLAQQLGREIIEHLSSAQKRSRRAA